jgi:hypothetical protein
MQHLSLKRLRGGDLRGSSFTGDPGRYVKKVSGYGYLSPWALLSIRGVPGMWGVSYTGDFERRLEGSSGVSSLCEVFHQEDLEGGLLYWETRKMKFLRDMQNAL